MTLDEIKDLLNEELDKTELESDVKSSLVDRISNQANEFITLEHLKAKLEVMHEFEKNHLELIKEFKEEIKFASDLQEGLRKERAKFFSETIKEVSNTLEVAQVDEKIAALWLTELTSNYINSLDICSSLTEENIVGMIGAIRQKAKNEIRKSEGEIKGKNQAE